MEKKPIIDAQWRNQYPIYARIYDGKAVSLADVKIENKNLGHAVELNILQGEFTGQHFFDFNPEGEVIFDILVQHAKK